MKISMQTMSVDSFVPMLESLAVILDKGAPYAERHGLDLVNARLAPDMYTLARQVQLACHHATDGVARLTGKPPSEWPQEAASLPDLKQLITDTITAVRQVPAAAFEVAESRDCSIQIPDGGGVLAMNGLQFLRAWALPHFYFHVVTAYDILRHSGVVIGKQDYLSQVGQFRRSA
jgi:uncharacterized protein